MSSAPPPAPIRASSQTASVYNEGLVAFLCDADRLDRLTELLSQTETSLWDETAGPKDPVLQKMAEERLVVGYELYQDDPLGLEVCVGEPPTTKERRLYPMQDLVRSHLRLTKGRLAVHSPNTAPWNEPGEDEPEILEVPPGDYVVTVGHIDFDEMSRRHGEDFDWEGPVHFVTLTPIDDHKPLKKSWPYLPYPVREVRALRRWSLRDGVFRGEVIRGSLFGMSPILTNLGEGTGRQMGLEFGGVYDVTIARKRHQMLMVQVEDLDVARAVFGERYFELAARHRSLYGGNFQEVQGRQERLLAIMRLDPKHTADVGNDNDKLEIAALVEKVEIPLFADAWDALARTEEGTEATVIGVGSHAILLACSLSDLPADVGGDVEVRGRRVRLAASREDALTEVARFALAPATRTKKERDALEAKRRKLIDDSFKTDDPKESDRLFQASNDLIPEIQKLSIPDEVHERGMPFCAYESRHWVFDRPVVQLRALRYGAEADLGVRPGDRLRFTAN